MHSRKGASLIESLSAIAELFIFLFINLASGAIGFIPSFLVTAITIQSFGLYGSAALIFAGEIVGALLGFYLYRYGFSKAHPKWLLHPFWQKFQQQSARRIFSMIILLRLLPFMPSGFVTAGAALTTISGRVFWIASTIGKIPAVVLELAVVYGLIQVVPINIQFILFGVILIVSVIFWIKSTRQKKRLIDGLNAQTVDKF